MNCLNCNKVISSKKFCSAICQNNYNYENYIEKWLNGECSGGKGVEQGHGTVSNYVRRYLFKKHNNKCSRCNWGEINPYTKTIPLEVEHIDGNPNNHRPDNLDLLCPNCHSLTSGHSTSKGNGRRYYRNHYIKCVDGRVAKTGACKAPSH